MNSHLPIKNFFKYIHKMEIDKLKKIIKNTDFKTSEIILKSSQDSGLHIAVRTGNSFLVEWLLDHGFDIFLEHQNNDGKRPLHEAAQLCFQEIVDILLRKGVEVDPLKRADWTPLMLATSKGHLGIIEKLIGARSSPYLANKDGWTAFHIACRNGDVRVVKYFLFLKKDIWNSKSKNGRTPLHTAALHGNTEVVKVLLEQGNMEDETDACGNTPLMEAVRSGHLDCVCLLVSQNGDSLQKMDLMGRMTIHAASEAGQEEIVRLLITKHKVNVNALSKNGQTPLHFAAKENHKDMIKLLSSLGADVNHPDIRGRTALWMSASSKKMECYNALKLLGAEDIADSEGRFPSSIILQKI